MKYMGLCYSRFRRRCDFCERTLHKNGPTIFYIFQGCGKYHKKIMCNECLELKTGFVFGDSPATFVYDNHSDPLGMSMTVKERI